MSEMDLLGAMQGKAISIMRLWDGLKTEIIPPNWLNMLTLIPLLLAFPQQVPEVAKHLEVHPAGAQIVEQVRAGGMVRQQRRGGQNHLVQAPRWIRDDGGSLWICRDVSVGDSGASLLASQDVAAQGVSCYPTGDAAPIFSAFMPDAHDPVVATADRLPYGAAMEVQDTDPSSAFDYQATVHVYDTCDQTGTPLWSYTFPNTLDYFGGGVLISDFAEVVLTWKADPNLAKLRVEAFDIQGNLLSSAQLDSPPSFHSRQTRLSDDGTRAYFNIGTDAVIYDVLNGVELFRKPIGASFDSHALSGDGQVFAFGNFGSLEVWKESTPGSWNQVGSASFSGDTYTAWLDLNTDGSLCAFQIQRFTPAYDHHEIGLFDVQAGSVLWTSSYDAPGTTLQLVASGVCFDEKADFIAGVSWGDSLNATPEGFVYNLAGVVTCEIDSRGSAFDGDLDVDGDVFAMGCKSIHANDFGNGGDVIVADPIEQELHLLGYPSLGAALILTVPQSAGNSISLAVSRSLGNDMSVLGPTELDFAVLVAVLPYTMPYGGLATNITIPANPSLLCQDLHAQAGLFGGHTDHLSNKVSLRVVP
ncbi:MAG: hypothetical protein DWQ01_10345 [Planctomycetota bacterium]|nr:MAG: hypothetical protein DWQ01_10345 [Planctomycetota bacterium]